MSNLTVFNFDGDEIRVVLVNGESWFVAADIAKVLEHSKASMLISSLKEREKGVSQISTLGGSQSMAVVSEPGLYRILMRSDKPKAEKFQDWLAEEVIPAIRKTGFYSKPKTQLEMLLETVQHQVELECRLAETESSVTSIKSEVDGIKKIQQEAERSLKALPESTKPVASRTTRSNINTLVRDYCHKTGISHSNIWKNLYREFRDRYHIDLKVRSANGKSAPLDIAESLDMIDDLYALACEMFK